MANEIHKWMRCQSLMDTEIALSICRTRTADSKSRHP